MAQLIADRRDIDFVLYEQLEADKLSTHKKFKEFNKKVFDMIISEARTLAIKEILPTNHDGDRQGVVFDKGKVTVPPCFHRPYGLLAEGAWTSMTASLEWGGQGLPEVINRAVLDYIWGANYCLANYGTMGHGTGIMIEHFGTQEQKSLYLQKLYSAQWGGTMLLTEPQAGSDLGALSTRAVKNQDGTYSITGTKIFITNGEHDLTDNIIHPVLARIEGAPAGTKGISIFVVPKIWVNPDGSLGEPNDVACTGVEEKLGIHASATCTLSLGEKGQCRGYLLGEENQGMKIMFYMMNEARLNVGFQAFTYGSAAYLYAANYAKERIQGKDLLASKSQDSPSVPIIQHPDVRRMLMWMKSHVDGMRSFVYYVYSLFDRIATETDSGICEKNRDLIDFFTPLVKAYLSQKSFVICAEAMQVYGGYGYTAEYPIEQLLRDCKITSIYEGTDGIQSMDLLGRKMSMKKGVLFQRFLSEVRETILDAKKDKHLDTLAQALSRALDRLEPVGQDLAKTAASPSVKTAFAFSFPFLDVTGDVIMAWMLLWRACVASKALASNPKKKDVDFYQGIIKTAEFYIHSQLPTTLGKMEGIHNLNTAAIDIPDACFGG
ncbi:MAG: acyl-CoA dehydrogenase [Proteobacteria bacterium]|nr:acyl-CoA dehydrogenase [Pseudomonadota bacterium]